MTALVAVLLLLFVSAVTPMVVYAETVILDDTVNHEDLALKADRMLKDSCERLMDCKLGVTPLAPQTMYSSAKGQKDYATMTSSTLDTTALHALFATNATQATNADLAQTAVWAQSSNTFDPAVTAFTADNINDTTIVNSAIYANQAFKLGYALSATNATMPAIYSMYVEGPYGAYPNGFIASSMSERLYSHKPSNAAFTKPGEARYVRNSSSYNNSGTVQNWSESGTIGAYAADTRPY